MSNINDEMNASAEYAISMAKEQFNQQLDYSESSLLHLENLLQQAYQKYIILTKEGKKLDSTTYRTATIWGSYLGEFIRRQWGGNWTKRGTERFIIINGVEFSPIAYIYQRITSLSDYSLEKYIAKIPQYVQKANTKDSNLPLDGKKQGSHAHIITSAFTGLLGLTVIALVFFGAWLFYRINLLEKSLIRTKSELAIMQTNLTNVQSAQAIMQTNIANTRSSLASTINTLTYVQALAENANKYAHSHTTFSDVRLKNNISEINDPLNGILSLHGVRFFWNTSEYPDLNLSSDPQIGFIAQELEQVYPELVTTDENGFKAVDYAKLVPVLVEAIKQQQFLIEDLGLQIIELQQNSK